MGAKIHSSSLVERGAELGENVEVGPFCTVSAGARIGNGTRLLSHVVIDGVIEIGADNTIHPFCVIGGPPQDLTYHSEPTRVVIGDRNTFRESVTISRGTAKGGGLTKVGNDNYIMAVCHFAHDTLIGNHNIMANQVALAGHVTVGNHVVISGQVGVVQNCRIGDYTFIGGSSVLRKDLPPYMCAKEFSEVIGPNLIGLKRNQVADENVRVASELYKIIYLGNLTTEKAMNEITERYPSNAFAQKFVEFVKSTKVGIQR